MVWANADLSALRVMYARAFSSEVCFCRDLMMLRSLLMFFCRCLCVIVVSALVGEGEVIFLGGGMFNETICLKTCGLTFWSSSRVPRALPLTGCVVLVLSIAFSP